MAGGIEEDAEGLARLEFGLPGAEFEDLRLGSVEVVYHDVDVHLLRMVLAGPARGTVVLDLLEADGRPGVGCDLCPRAVVVDADLPVEEVAVELGELTSIRSIENDHGLLCDSHGAESTPVDGHEEGRRRESRDK